jgi:hypothetical protein
MNIKNKIIEVVSKLPQVKRVELSRKISTCIFDYFTGDKEKLMLDNYRCLVFREPTNNSIVSAGVCRSYLTFADNENEYSKPHTQEYLILAVGRAIEAVFNLDLADDQELLRDIWMTAQGIESTYLAERDARLESLVF